MSNVIRFARRINVLHPLCCRLFIHKSQRIETTNQYLMVPMFNNSKKNGGFVDETVFKTALHYNFDSLLFDDNSTEIVDDYIYITFVRPLLHPNCDYVLVTRNGTQYNKLSDLIPKLVFEEIGKYIHPTRYRQIVETESVRKISLGEQDIMSRDQKHSSQVAKTHHQKLSSREIVEKAKHCFGKLCSSPSEKGCLRSDKQITPTKCKPNDIQESCAGNHKSHETSDEADSAYDEIFLTPAPLRVSLCETKETHSVHGRRRFFYFERH